LRLILSLLVIAGLVGAVIATALGLLAGWVPLLELFNHFRPFILAGTLVLLGLAFITRRRSLVILSALLALINLGLFVIALQGAAATAAPGSQRFLRVVTLNLWMHNQRIDLVADFLRQADGDVVSLEEVETKPGEQLTELLRPIYPYVIGDGGILLLSKLPPVASGHVNGAKLEGWARLPLILWAKFDKEGFEFELAGVHPAWPFNPRDQVADTDSLIAFARNRSAPLILAGDFNLTPWSLKLQRLTGETELGRANTFYFTWPANPRLPMKYVTPFVAIDNVFVSRQFAIQSISAGPYVGSDHRPLIADIALSKQNDAAAQATENPK
jgi:endonuclease/exonuclease/phosphatase (EEP) superfamily protein YafD